MTTIHAFPTTPRFLKPDLHPHAPAIAATHTNQAIPRKATSQNYGNCAVPAVRAVGSHLVPRSNNPTTAADLESATSVVRRFYGGINGRDLGSVEGLIAVNCIYEDLVFPKPFVGRKAILDFFKQFIDSISRDLQFAIDDISEEEDSSTVGVTWHLGEMEGKTFSFEQRMQFLSVGCNQWPSANNLWERLCGTCHQTWRRSFGYGHISPFLELAKKLTATGDFKVYLCSTLATLNSIEHKITDAMSQSIKLVPILFPAFPDLPRKLHTTNGLPPNLMPRLKEAMKSPVTEAGFSDILSDLKPDLIIYDFLQPWLPSLAMDHNIPAVQLVTSSCTAISVMCHYYKNPTGNVGYPFPEIRYKEYESGEMDKMLAMVNDPKDTELVFTGLEGSNSIVLVKGFREIESRYFDYASRLIGKRFLSVGPLVQEPGPDDKDALALLNWLDQKEPKSTVFVSFGSEFFLETADLEQIALGLELSGVSFVWVVRFPKDGNSLCGMLEKTMPEGFLERVGSRGRVLEGWAPQAKILGHESTGGFVSHCGWNSVLESMSYGVPIIALPMQHDQPANARLVQNVGVGVEVLRDEKGDLHGEALAKVIRKVVEEDCGEAVRKKASSMKKKLVSKGDEEFDHVVDELMALVGRS